MKQNISIKKYHSISKFLNDYYELRKKMEKEFSYSIWAKELGLKNRGYLRLIVQGQRPIGETLADNLSEVLQLDESETDYFFTLINYNQSKNREQRRIFGKKILNYQKGLENFHEIENHYDFLSNPLLPRLLTLLSFTDVSTHTRTAAQILNISKSDLESACQLLANLSLIEANNPSEDHPEWRTKKRSWHLPSNFKDLAYREFYLNSLGKAANAIDSFPSEERRFRSLFMAMNPNEFQDFLKDFEVFIQEQIVKRDVSTFAGRRLYQLCFALFPDSETMRENINL